MLDPNTNRNNSNNGNNVNNNANNSIKPVMPYPLVQNVVNTSLPQGQLPFRPQQPQQAQAQPRPQQAQQSQVQPQMQQTQQAQQAQRPQQAQGQVQMQQPRLQPQPNVNNSNNSSNSNKDSEEIIRHCRTLISDVNSLKELSASQVIELKQLLDKAVTAIDQNHHINNLTQQNVQKNIQQSIQQNFQQIVEIFNSSNTSNASLKSEVSQLVEANSKYISKDDFNKGVNFIANRLSGTNNSEVSNKIEQLTSSINNFASQLAQVQKHQQLQQAQLKQLIDYLANSANNNFGNSANVGNVSSSTANNKSINKLTPANNQSQSTSSNTNNSISQSTNPIKQLLEKDIPLPFVSYQITVKNLLVVVGVIAVLLLVAIGS